MNIFILFILSTLFISLFLFTLNKISEPVKDDNKITAKILKMYSNSASLTPEEQEIMINKEFEAHRAAAIATCLSKNYGFDCSGYACSCTIDTEIACNSYIQTINSKISDPNTPSQEKEELNSKIRYWDNDVKRCIETVKAINSEICKTVQEIDKKNTYTFRWNKPKLANCTDTRCDTIEKMPTCIIPDGYCRSRGLDQDYPDNPYDSGDCYTSTTQYWLEQFLGEEVVRCARVGDLDCIYKSLNIPMALADAYCAKVLGLKEGCGFPEMLPSLDEAWRMLKNPWEIPSFFISRFVGTVEVGIKILEGTLAKLGIVIDNLLTSDNIYAVRDYIIDGMLAAYDIFETAWDYIEEEVSKAFNQVGGAFETAGTWVYDTFISPLINLF